MRVTVSNIATFSINRESMLNLLLCVVWASALIPFFRGIINHLPILGEHTDAIIPLFYIIPAILALPALINRFSLADYLFFFALVFYYVANYVFFPDNTFYLNENAFLCLCCVYPFYFLGRVVDIDKLFNTFLILSVLCICMNLFYFLVYAPGNKNMDEVAGADNMFAAYQALPHVTMLLWATLEKFRVWKAVVFVLGVLFLLSCGTRGPLVCLGFFGLVYFFFYMNFKGAVYVKIGIISLALLVLAFLRDIALFFYQTFTELQLSTRIIEKFIIGDLSNDSFRSVLREKIYSVLDNGNHFWGLGLFGCKNYGVVYPHFLPLDLACTFGYMTGYTLLILLLLLIGWSLWITKGKRVQLLIIMLFSIAIVKLLMTGSFANEPYLYMLIGVCVREVVFTNPTDRIKKKEATVPLS